MASDERSKILQIIPADGWCAAIATLDPETEVMELRAEPLVGWALMSDVEGRKVVGLVVNSGDVQFTISCLEIGVTALYLDWEITFLGYVNPGVEDAEGYREDADRWAQVMRQMWVEEGALLDAGYENEDRMWRSPDGRLLRYHQAVRELKS